MDDLKINRKYLLDYLGDVEKKYPVETWTINDIHIWPLIKIDLFFRVATLERSEFSNKTRKKSPILNFFEIIFKAIPSLVNYLLFRVSSKKDMIPYFFSDSSSHRVWFEDKYINRYFYPLEEQIKGIRDHISSLTINDDLSGYGYYPKDENILFIQKYIHGSKILRLFKGQNYPFSCSRFDEFLAGIQQKFPVLKIDSAYKKELSKRVFNILAISDIIDVLIQRHQPKVIFELCYYSTLRFAINYSAYRNKISTIEIQHGGMGKEHVAYSGWGNVPQEGYNLLPQIFWVWDRSSEELVNEWSRNNSFHRTVLGGNPWLTFALKHSDHYQFPHDKKVILFTLQADLVSGYIYEAIKQSSDEYEWWVRDHPRFPQVGMVFKNELEKRGISHRVVLDRANQYPLPILLNKCGIHLSGSSGSILEAALLGVRSLILDQTGEKYYYNLMESGEAFPVFPKNAARLLMLINQLFDQTPKEGQQVNKADNIKILETVLSI